MSAESLKKLAAKSPKLKVLYSEIAEPILATPPFSLGYPGDLAQSAYYPGLHIISKEEIALVSQALEGWSIFPENTRIRKVESAGTTVFEVLQASVEEDEICQEFPLPDSKGVVRICRGDHSGELALVCSSLATASKHAANETQKEFLAHYIEIFRTGSLHAYRDSQRIWITDKAPLVENISGFVEPYRDPYGTRAEFEGLVAISDIEETKALTRLVENSATFIKRLSWAEGAGVDDGKGSFEKTLFEPPDFTSIHILVYCSSIIFPGINLPNCNNIRQECGSKNVIISNRMSAESKKGDLCPFIDESEAETFQKHKYPAYYWWVVLHELPGHGTSKMMVKRVNTSTISTKVTLLLILSLKNLLSRGTCLDRLEPASSEI